MNIVVVGAGKVGERMADQLALEGHDVVIIDNDPVIADKMNSSDVNFVQGNGAFADVQRAAGVENADVLLAVTSMDEVNMLVCLLAKKLGAKNTIARVRNPEYVNQMYMIEDDLGLAMYINPEHEAADEISRLLRFPSAMTVDQFSQGRVELVEYRLKDDSKLNDVPLYELGKKFPGNALICAVERDNKVYIPTGSFVLKAKDKISIAARPEEMERFFKKTDLFKKRKIKDVMIIGGSKISFYLGKQLSKMGMNVKIIENDPVRCKELASMDGNISVILGDGSDHNVLLEEGLETTDAVVALTGIDEENIIISMYAATKNVPKIIAKVNKTGFLEMIDNTETQTYVSPKIITANKILQYVRAMENSLGSNVETLHTIVNDRVEALEFRIRSNARCTGIPLKDLVLIDNLLIACIIRSGRVIIPGGNDVILEGDNVIVVTTNKRLSDINDIMK